LIRSALLEETGGATMRAPIAVAFGLVVYAGCAGGRTAERTSSTTTGEHTATAAPPAEMGKMCPTDVPGTKVAAADTPDGESLTFTTTSGEVDELRRRVRGMADMHNQHHAGSAAGAGHGGTAEHGGMGHGGMMTGGHSMAQGGGMMMPPPSNARVDDLENGARIVLTPTDPAQTDQLRSAVRMHAEHMQRNGCGMMMMQPSR